MIDAWLPSARSASGELIASAMTRRLLEIREPADVAEYRARATDVVQRVCLQLAQAELLREGEGSRDRPRRPRRSGRRA